MILQKPARARRQIEYVRDNSGKRQHNNGGKDSL